VFTFWPIRKVNRERALEIEEKDGSSDVANTLAKVEYGLLSDRPF
jgi:hypothetical protein